MEVTGNLNRNLESKIYETDFYHMEEDMKKQLKKNRVITEILQKLEEDVNFEDAVESILKIVGEYLELSGIVVSKMISEEPGFSVIRRWDADGQGGDIDNISKLSSADLPPVAEAVTVMRAEDASGKQKIFMDKCNVKSMMAVPIMLNNAPAMFAIFIEKEKEREWDKETYDFVLDVCKMIQSILYKRVSKNSLVSSYNALKEILSNIGSAVFVIDKYSKDILFANEIALRMSGKNLLEKKCYDFFYNGYNEFRCKSCNPHRTGEYFEEVYNEGRHQWQEIKFTDISWVDGREVSLCVVTDVTEKKKYQQRIEFQANNDFLTGLYNRMRCEEDLEICIRKSVETKKQGLLLFIDLDDFKNINDGLGHQYGDMLLRMISMKLQEISEIEKRCYRVGGDEFIVIIEPEIRDKASDILKRIKDMFASPWYLNGTEYYCTMSMGIVEFLGDSQDVNDLIKKADIAMYDAKRGGKNQCVYYNSGEDITIEENLNLEKNMRYAVSIGCNEFEIYIQPIVNMKTEKCIGGEALVRWNSGKLGFMSPGQFIPMAENLGLITPIGEYVLKQACMVNKKWSDMGHDMRLNVNLSIIQLLRPDVVDTISEIMEKTGVKRSNMVLEVTESLAINDMGRMKEIIKDIKKLGVRIALDDFGTGYSSLNYIKKMDMDIIKVDRTFIKDIVDDDYAQAFIKLITELSAVLNAEVCVEGVETIEQLQTLKSTNVSMIQGFYFGRPMPVSEFEEKFVGL